MTEAERIAMIESVPLILTALGTLVSAIMGLWAVIVGKSVKKDVNGSQSKMLAALEAGHRAETKTARVEGIVDTLVQTAPVEKVIVPGTASDRRGPNKEHP